MYRSNIRQHAKHSEQLIILGNGPSLKNVKLDELSPFDTFGLNGAFRIYKEIDWHPRFYGLLDEYKSRPWGYEEINAFVDDNRCDQLFFFDCERDKITNTDKTGFIDILKPNYIKYDHERFYEPLEETYTILRRKLGSSINYYFDHYQEPFQNMSREGIEHFIMNGEESQDYKLELPRYKISYTLPESFDRFFYVGANAAVTACKIGICMGYSKILLLGIDAKWEKEGEVYKSTKNHWFDGYYPEKGYDPKTFCDGDWFRPETMHINNWTNFKEALDAHDVPVKIINCNPDSAVQCFDFSTLEDELK